MAKLLFKNLFGHEPEIKKESQGADVIGAFLVAWAELEKAQVALSHSLGLDRGTTLPRPASLGELVKHGILDSAAAKELDRLRQIRNQIAHGRIDDYKATIGKEAIASLTEIQRKLEAKLKEVARVIGEVPPILGDSDG